MGVDDMCGNKYDNRADILLETIQNLLYYLI